ncbi:MAG: glycosyl transferase [Ardenticatenaceae bacterium]|nr:MAG: glycosyl transferase [Ardenticatenaceae bacterium]
MPTPLLFVDHAQQLGGAEHSLLMLIQHLDRSLWQPQLACPPGELADAAQRLNIPWNNLSLPRLRRSLKVGADWLRASRTLRTIAHKIDAKVLVANTVRAAFYTSVAAKLAKRPFIWHMRDFWLSESPPRYRSVDALLKKALCASAAHVVANSAATASHLPCANVTVVHNGIDLTRFSDGDDGTLFRQAYDIPQNAPLIGIVGRLRPWKGQHHFVEMAATVSQTHPTPQFVIVGGSIFDKENDYTNFLKELAQSHDLGDKVHFTGQISNTARAFAAIDIFVHSGDPEPFGLVNIEAMAASKPVVAFAHGALPEIVVHGETGLLVPPSDIPALATAVQSLLDAPEHAEQLGMAGRSRVHMLFTIQQTAERFSLLLQQTLKDAK